MHGITAFAIEFWSIVKGCEHQVTISKQTESRKCKLENLGQAEHDTMHQKVWQKYTVNKNLE